MHKSSPHLGRCPSGLSRRRCAPTLLRSRPPTICILASATVQCGPAPPDPPRLPAHRPAGACPRRRVARVARSLCSGVTTVSLSRSPPGPARCPSCCPGRRISDALVCSCSRCFSRTPSAAPSPPARAKPVRARRLLLPHDISAFPFRPPRRRLSHFPRSPSRLPYCSSTPCSSSGCRSLLHTTPQVRALVSGVLVSASARPPPPSSSSFSGSPSSLSPSLTSSSPLRAPAPTSNSRDGAAVYTHPAYAERLWPASSSYSTTRRGGEARTSASASSTWTAEALVLLGREYRVSVEHESSPCTTPSAPSSSSSAATSPPPHPACLHPPPQPFPLLKRTYSRTAGGGGRAVSSCDGRVYDLDGRLDGVGATAGTQGGGGGGGSGGVLGGG
ncbi:hypothetical protein B0H10DRAFT_829018 [Mycena sp. CBHHK59/15]|nr:hypothetical protein B0H10DRAFT_829018 [Mycena sp. CBHHK59/15]